MRIVFIIGLLALLIFTSGCATLPEPTITDEPAFFIKKVFETNWLATMFIVGVAASIFMLVRAMATGFPLLCASVGGLIFLRLDQTLAKQTWPYLAMGLLLLAGFCWYFYTTYIHKRAFREVVAGGEWFKKAYPQGVIDFKAMQAESQSKPTEKLVKKVKKKLGKEIRNGQ